MAPMSNDAINEIVHVAAGQIVALCHGDADAVVMACFGLLGHCADSFGMKNEDVHKALAEILAQREAP